MIKFQKWDIASVSNGVWWWILVSQMTYYIFNKSNTVFDTIVDAGAIPNTALEIFFFLELPLITAPVIARQPLY